MLLLLLVIVVIALLVVVVTAFGGYCCYCSCWSLLLLLLLVIFLLAPNDCQSRRLFRLGVRNKGKDGKFQCTLAQFAQPNNKPETKQTAQQKTKQKRSRHKEQNNAQNETQRTNRNSNRKSVHTWDGSTCIFIRLPLFTLLCQLLPIGTVKAFKFIFPSPCSKSIWMSNFVH